jgi:hypothetical protein
MSPRRLFRIVACTILLAFLWLKIGREWHDWSVGRIAVGVALSLALLIVVIAQILRFDQRWRKMREEVPKKPLGLDT